MALTPGVLTFVQVLATQVTVSATKPSDGTPPYTYQFYRSTTSGFSPGPSNAIGDPIESSADSVSLTDSGLTPGTVYYYDCIATEDGVSPDTADYTAVDTQTAPPTQSPNQFTQQPYLGMIDMRFPYNTVSVLIDMSETGSLYSGQAVKMVDSAGGVPKVTACDDNDPDLLGFINFDVKTVAFTAGMPAEISMAGNVMYLYATGAIARSAQVASAGEVTRGGVKEITGSSGDVIVGWAFDKATAAGQLIRVFLKTPTFELD